MADNTQKIVDVTAEMVESFSDNMDKVQKKLYNQVFAIVKEISVDSDGNIKRTVDNFNKITKIQSTLQSVVNNPDYKKLIGSINSSINDITKMQSNFFKTNLDDYSVPKIIDKLKQQSFDNVLTQLTESGVNANVADAATKIVSDGVKAGDSFFKMSRQLEEFIIGTPEVDGKLVSYSKQVVNDTLHGAARNLNSVISVDLDLQWYQYVGALTKGVKNKTNNKRHGGSREWCIELVKKQWIHESELPGICRGKINGKTVSLAGLMPDTTKDNVIDRCGGYNCNHQMIPVPIEFVPTKIRRKFEKNIPEDEDEKTDSRPKRKK